MPLISLDLINFRSFEKSALEFHPKRNLIFGGNAAGKSSLLEAIQFLSTNRSSRTGLLEKLVRVGADTFAIRGVSGYQHTKSISINYGQGQKQLLIDGVPGAKISDLARALPVLAVSPESHFEFQRDSKSRRGALDWILFHVEQDYQTIWSRYHRCLLQRNAELRRSTSQKSVATWDEELSLHGEVIQDRRSEVVSELGRYFSKIGAKLFPSLGVAEISLKLGWGTDSGMLVELARNLAADRQRGFTQSGPHKNDLLFKFNDLNTIQDLSHGQKKLVYIALRAAQAIFLHDRCGLDCVFLVDDLSAELDEQSQKSVYELLADFPAQVFVTSLEPETWAKVWPDLRSFHVKHGTTNLVWQK